MSTTRQRGYGPLYTSGFHPSLDRSSARDRLAADLDAFGQAGGHIEVLGVTPLRRKPDKEGAVDGASPIPSAVVPDKRR